ncbi:hypothetical protein J3R30DRAFT_2131880 [Lentinula aciculospora]|uniref:intramembrane prenyl-peptidase Rce1 n=1 Tax=Lentinula aciculospora TaxID=153920 RepID=A0A9W9AGK4_9AGAR|nr:hypothetical protein J3R30DRAFT_2131880 [Lentinula aciculospora]
MQDVALSPTIAHSLGLAFASVYVGSIYVSKNARLVFKAQPTLVDSRGEPRERLREENERWRDDPDVIKARLVAVSIATLLCVGVVCWITRSISAALPLLGLWPSFPTSLSSLRHIVAPHLVTPLLFLGPLYAKLLSFSPQNNQRGSLWMRTKLLFCNVTGLRNYVVAPITEEIVFRACVLSVYLLSPGLATSQMGLVFTTPLNFGVAHLHHAWDTYNRLGRTAAALQRAILVSLFQMMYTTLFGALCAYLFLQTRYSIFVPVTAHIFCNIMGFPDLAGDLRLGESEGRKGGVIAAYLFGVVGFSYSVTPAGRWWWTFFENTKVL